MKILLDNIAYSNAAHGGISNYWFEWSRYLLNKPDQVFFNDEKGGSLNFHRALLNIPAGQIINNPKSSASSIIRRLSATDGSDSLLKGHLLYHSSYYRPLKNHRDYREVTTVHDFTHDYYFPRHKRIMHNLLKYPSLKRSSGIICISKNTYSDLLKFCPPRRHQKVEVIYNGVSDEYFPVDSRFSQSFIEEHKLSNRFILYIGSRAHYKNFDFTVELLNRLQEFNFVIVGRALSDNERKLFTDNCIARTKILSNISNAELNLLYNAAHALVYPSSYEGFGIPVIEAMRAGCPVLAMKTSSITEVSGNAALLSDGKDLNYFKVQIKKLSDRQFRSDLAGYGFENAAQFSWKRCCDETYEFYKQVY